MAVPRKKVSKSRRNQRRAHDALTALNFCPCPKCKAPRLPHSVCETCGSYKDRTLPRNILRSSLSVG
jgi:large subunit ribosomal protein L32